MQLDILQKRNVLLIIFLSIKITIMVRYIPLRYYFDKYLSKMQKDSIDLQHFNYDICLIKRIIRFIPWKITCLMESLIVKNYLFKYEVYLPISVGVDNSKEIKAHAWYIGEMLEGFHEIKLLKNDE